MNKILIYENRKQINAAITIEVLLPMVSVLITFEKKAICSLLIVMSLISFSFNIFILTFHSLSNTIDKSKSRLSLILLNNCVTRV